MDYNKQKKPLDERIEDTLDERHSTLPSAERHLRREKRL